ncbi:alpha-ribazole phosphatase CobZ [Candidatus Alkanophaga liquidiphilum]
MRGVEVINKKRYIEVRSTLPLGFEVLSSAPFNGGLRRAKAILNVHVPHDFNEDSEAFYLRFLIEEGFEPAEVVGLLTAASMGNAEVVAQNKVLVVATAGCTINVIVVVAEKMTASAMTNAIIVATEAKAAALRDLDVRYKELSKDGSVITGTPTDAVVIACLNSDGGTPHKYAGVLTEIGSEIYECVREAVEKAFVKERNAPKERSLLKRLEELGISFDAILDAALELYVGELPKELVRAELEELMKKECEDVNVALLISSAFFLEEEARKRRGLRDDPVNLLADELIGIDIAEYIGGKKALFNFVYYDTRKPGILRELPPFLDDVVGGFIAGCMTKLFELLERTPKRATGEGCGT